MEHRWKRLISYYKPYKGLFLLDLLLAVVGAGVTLAIPLIVRYITNQVVYFPGNEPFRMIVKMWILMVALALVEWGCNFFIAYCGHMMGARIEHDMRNDIFGHYQKLSFHFYDNQKVGQLLSRVTTDLFDISELLHHGPEDVTISAIKQVGSFVILLQINVNLTMLTYDFHPVMLVYELLFNQRLHRAYRANKARIADVNTQIEDSLSGIRTVKSFGNEEIEMEKFRSGNERFVESRRKSYWNMAWFHSVLTAMTTLVTVVVLVGGAYFITVGQVEVADLVTYLLYINNFTEPVKKLMNFTEQFQSGWSGYLRFLEVMDVESDIQDAPGAKTLRDVQGDVRFENVSFRYEEGLDKVLNHIDLDVRRGEYIAIVGNSGGGKTTLCSLIPRFYDVEDGRILIDGTDIRQVTLRSLRSQIGIVQQDVYLFMENVMENIRYGRPDAPDEAVIAAAKMANAHEFIMQLPEGYQTDIGQRGVKLSGGQKQRIAIARVFLKNPSILIFDEATSALDNESEKIVQQSMEKLAKGRTTFVIAHRLSTIQNAEKILVLTEKGIEEQGTHQELMEKNGAYAHLYRAAK